MVKNTQPTLFCRYKKDNPTGFCRLPGHIYARIVLLGGIFLKRDVIFFTCLLIMIFSTAAMHTQEAMAEPVTETNVSQAQTVTVNRAKELACGTPVILTGNITRSVGRDYYVFRDTTGEITVEIDQTAWRGMSIGASDTVEIGGNLEIKRGGRIVIEVQIIRRVYS